MKKNRSSWDNAMDFVLEKVRANIPPFRGGYPSPASEKLVFGKEPNTDWTTGFWTGLLYQCWLYDRNPLSLDAAQAYIPDFQHRLEHRIHTDTHDLGFLYILSCKADWMVRHNRISRAIALEAADLLMERYLPKAGIIQAWGALDDPDQQGRMIIDCLMNLPLLFWASRETHDGRYERAAANHLHNARTYLIRQDDSTFHTYRFDPDTGQPLSGGTWQGYRDDSCWARGQAWGIYGLCLNYRYTEEQTLLDDAMRLADYFLHHLPSDMICHWDLAFTSGPEERDSSAAAIAACGLLELSASLPVATSNHARYEKAALQIMESLADTYTTADHPESNGILQHGVYSKPEGNGVDECTIWGDYFYTEALVRICRNPALFW